MFCYVIIIEPDFKSIVRHFFHMFLFSRFEGSAGLTYVAPGTVCAIHLVYESTERLKRLLKRHGIRTTTKPLRTLEQHFPSPKDRPLPEKQTNVVYKINFAQTVQGAI